MFFFSVRVYLPTLNRVRYESSVLFVHCLISIVRLQYIYVGNIIQITCSVLAMVMIIIGRLLYIISFSYFSRLLKVFKVLVVRLVLTMIIVTRASIHLGISILSCCLQYEEIILLANRQKITCN